MSRTFEESFNRERDEEEEEVRIKQFNQAAEANPAMVGLASRATPTRRGGTGWVPTARPAKMMARNTTPNHAVEDKENAPRNTRSPLGGSARKATATLKSSAQKQVAASGRRASPRQRAGTGRAVTARDAAFVRRVKAPTPEPEPEPEPVKAEVLPNRGRRTGLRLRQEIQKDEFGLEDVSEFWDAEEVTEPSVHSRRVSFKPSLGGMSPVSHRTSTTGRRSSGHSLTSNTSVAGSELPTDMDESSDMEVDASPAAESSRRSSLRSSSSLKSKSSDLDSSMVSPDSDTIRKISFDGGSGNRSRSSAASSRRSDAEEEQEPSVDHSMGQEEEEDEPDQPSFDDRPDDDVGMDESVEEDKSRRPSDIFDEADKAGEEEEQRKRKRAAKDGDSKKRELDALARAGRASYAATDTYAPKAGRLSMFAPRPEVDEDDTTRRSKRRKMRPLEYWRNERVVYQRVNKSPHTPRERGPRYKGTPKAVVPEIVDIQIRSPEATPWRRNYKPKKEQEATDSVDSKSHTVKKAARKQKKKVIKSDKEEKKVKKRVVQAESSDEEEEQSPPAKAAASSKKARAAKAPSPKAAKASPPKEGEKRKTAFFLFCKEKRPEVRRGHPNASIPEQAMVLSEMWRGMDDASKDHYRSMVAAA